MPILPSKKIKYLFKLKSEECIEHPSEHSLPSYLDLSQNPNSLKDCG